MNQSSTPRLPHCHLFLLGALVSCSSTSSCPLTALVSLLHHHHQCHHLWLPHRCLQRHHLLNHLRQSCRLLNSCIMDYWAVDLRISPLNFVLGLISATSYLAGHLNSAASDCFLWVRGQSFDCCCFGLLWFFGSSIFSFCSHLRLVQSEEIT